jgi:hypothetical protein
MLCIARNDGGDSVEPLRLTANLSNPIKLMLPVQSVTKKYFASRFAQITSISPAVLLPLEGRFAIVTDVGSGMRWTRLHLEDERCSPRTAKSCGPDAPTLASSFVESSAKRWWQESPVTRESPKETVKTIRVRECRVIPARPW